jgi:hypothetical protein
MQTLGFQDARDRRSSDLMPEILESTLDARVTPCRIVLDHLQHKLPNLG